MSDENQQPESPKVIDAAHIIEIDEEVIRHGILFVHPQVQPFKLLFAVKDGQLLHHFLPIDAPPQSVKPESKVIMPDKKLILPGGNA